MDQAKKLHQIIYTETRRVPKGGRIFQGELISGGAGHPPWPAWTEGMIAPYDCTVYERSENMAYEREAVAPDRVAALLVATNLWLHLGSDPVKAIADTLLGQRAEEAERCAEQAHGIIVGNRALLGECGSAERVRNQHVKRAQALRTQARAGGTQE